MNISTRSKSKVDVKHFTGHPLPDDLGGLHLIAPQQGQYLLRVCVKHSGGELLIPDFLQWIKPLLNKGLEHQATLGNDHPFVYVTVRVGKVESVTDDHWHLDGFSTRIEHVPEQNYIYTDCYPTEYIKQSVSVPDDLDPTVYNMNTYLDKFVDAANVVQCKPYHVYCVDPYVLHKRPQVPAQVFRTFVRVSFVPIEIDDINNSQNPLLPLTYTKNGVEFRDTLKHYII